MPRPKVVPRHTKTRGRAVVSHLSTAVKVVVTAVALVAGMAILVLTQCISFAASQTVRR
jgi:hypothetical protein